MRHKFILTIFILLIFMWIVVIVMYRTKRLNVSETNTDRHMKQIIEALFDFIVYY